jgi:hypothetical protein
MPPIWQVDGHSNHAAPSHAFLAWLSQEMAGATAWLLRYQLTTTSPLPPIGGKGEPFYLSRGNHERNFSQR